MTDARLRPRGRMPDDERGERPHETYTEQESRLIVGVVIGMAVGLAGTVLVALAWWLGVGG